MQKIKLVYLLCLYIALNSCARHRLPSLNNWPKAKKVYKSYDRTPLLWENYIYYHDSVHQGKRHEGRVSLQPQDSVLNIVIPVVINNFKLNVIKVDNLTNKVSYELTDQAIYLRAGRINNDIILKSVTDSGAYIFPIFYSRVSRNFSITGGYTFAHKVYSGSDAIVVVIYIINKKQIIYKRSARLFSVHQDGSASAEVFTRTIQPQHWQLIIDKALEDYIKRLKPPPN